MKLSNEHNRFVSRVEKRGKEIVCTGEKLLVDRLLTYIQDFFDSNTFYSKHYNDFSYEDLEFFRKVIKAKLTEYSVKFKTKMSFEANQIRKDSVTFEKIALKVTTNKIKHEKFHNFLSDSLKHKQVENFKLKDKEALEYFYESKGLKDILNIEREFECAIFLPIHLEYFEQFRKSEVDLSKIEESQNASSPETITSFSAFYEMPNVADVSFSF